jgi:hypothetical protein
MVWDMTPLIPSLATVAVSALYCLWQMHLRAELRRRSQVLRERVAYMLWVAAQQTD